MDFRKLVFILPLLWPFDVRAQVPEEYSAPEQWQLTLDVIKAKAQRLMIKNNDLQFEHKQLTKQVQELQQSISDQQLKNDQLVQYLNERHGRTDQQLQIEQLTRGMKAKRQKARILDEQWRALKNSTRTQPSDDDLSRWRKQLEDENRQEVLLQNELQGLQAGDRQEVLETQNKEFEAQLDGLQRQLSRHIKSPEQLAMENARRYEQLKMRKDQLEASINAYEVRMDELRDSSLMALSWPAERKKLVHAMVQLDSSNSQMRDKIKVLHEDIGVLKDQVAALEHRLNLIGNQAAKQ